MPSTDAPVPPSAAPSFWLSDRTVLKLALWAIALAVMASGLRIAMAGASMTVVQWPEGEHQCIYDGPDGIECNGDEPQAHVTGTGRTLQAVGGLVILAGGALLIYQAVRWPPRAVGEFLPRQVVAPAPEAESGVTAP